MHSNPRFLRLSAPALAAGAIALIAGVAVAATTTFTFSAIAAGSTWFVGDIYSAANADAVFKKFQWSSGTWTDAGVATVTNSNWANGSPSKELNLNNINVRMIPDTPAYAANYLYADLGGNVNFGVNGDFRNVADLIVLDGTVVGNCDISVTAVPFAGGVHGEVIITPQSGYEIDYFGVGGQEFFIDDVTFDY